VMRVGKCPARTNTKHLSQLHFLMRP
jgi:hypothetical protein